MFAAYLPPGSRDGVVVLDLPEDATVGDVMRRLGIPADSTRVVLVNGHDAAPEQSLAPDDVVAVFPPLAGGGHAPEGGAPRAVSTVPRSISASIAAPSRSTTPLK
ncbi:MAG: hypothetical protein A2W08_00970 [Candidatus Rokubacteria bacterium RBG_16_73_20]|nr:MAG: hypothetical protein A2W08_00970 [Candidatus Rokubacteria bacterium RBG_16_73_20]